MADCGEESVSLELSSINSSMHHATDPEDTSRGCCGWRAGLCGLMNTGNTCYLNAVLQCMISTVPLAEYFLSTPTRQTQGLTGAFCRLLEEVWLHGTERFRPDEIRARVCELHPQFNSNLQQDSHKLLLVVLNGIHTELKQPDEGTVWESTPGRGRKRREDTVVTRLFKGELRYEMLCVECRRGAHARQPCTVLSLPLPPHTYKCSIQDCLDMFFQQCVLTSKEQMFCPQCEVSRDTTVLTTIKRTPEILILHLKRISFDSRGLKMKLRTNVLFSLDSLDLSLFLPHPLEHHTHYYLYAVLNHSGDVDGGHFTAYCRNMHTNTWYKFDDAMVTEIQDYIVQSPNAYILFYARKQFPQRS